MRKRPEVQSISPRAKNRLAHQRVSGEIPDAGNSAQLNEKSTFDVSTKIKYQNTDINKVSDASDKKRPQLSGRAVDFPKWLIINDLHEKDKPRGALKGKPLM